MAAELVLGTVQLGIPYGAANTTGMPSEEEARAILCSAVQRGVKSIDTARIYGLAEARIGAAWPELPGQVEITTKVTPLAHLGEESSPADARAAGRADVFESLFRLRRTRVDALLLHRWHHRRAWGGALWDLLLELQAEGLIGRLGTSLSTPSEAVEALADKTVQQIQLPFNLLDDRWLAREFLALRASRPDVVIHARSAYLQGILTSPAERWPKGEGWSPDALVQRLHHLAESLGRSVKELALAYARSQPWIDGVVVGMETQAQLEENLALFASPGLSAEECAAVAAEFRGLPEGLLNPALWPRG